MFPLCCFGSQDLLKTYNNKNILIIGGSTGIGRSLALEFVSYNANVMITGRNQDSLDATLRDLQFHSASKDSKHYAISADCSKIDAVTKCFELVDKSFNKVDLIIFSAGIGSLSKIDNFNLKEARDIVETNLIGLLNNLEFILPIFRKQKFGHLAVIASIAGYRGLPDSIAYAPSKAALHNLTESLYIDLKKYNIDVTLINPGFIKTKFVDKNDFNMPSLISPEKCAKHAIQRLARKKWLIQYPYGFTSFVQFMRYIPFPFYSIMVLFSYNRNKKNYKNNKPDNI